MAKIRVLNKDDIKAAFTLTDALKAVEQAYSEKNSGKGEIWPIVFHEFEPGKAEHKTGGNYKSTQSAVCRTAP